ncbi:pyridoxine 4-dehydrogenase [Cercophora scortea]|uniref:Pyridoxine 4-dehydrogenase n=1 Tax=Cercophora scortea TaxID=314031 RepID=A0AAE0MDJ4_9PEZI|nr:pyridoxine 4-dehydrogenase [Cercophora scortea]
MSRPAAPTTILGKAVGPIGYGMLGLTIPWAATPYPDAVKVMKTALDRGANFWNGSLFYGTPEANSLHLLKYYFTQHPEDAAKVVLCIKGAYDSATHTPNGSPAGIRASVDEALRILDGTKTIDIFECARVDPKVPIETSVQALGELVAEGKIGGVGLSEVSARTIRAAHAVHPVACVEIELSLFTPDALTNGVVDTCRELNIPITAYGPVARGWLTGKLHTPADLPANDFRHRLPRFQPGAAFDANAKLAQAVENLAARKGVIPSQVAIAWVRQQGGAIIPIPGSTKPERVVENTAAADVWLSEQDLEELKGMMEALPVSGERYGGAHELLLNQ